MFPHRIFIILLSGTISLSGCSYFESHELPDTGLGRTGAAAATGAVIGAGLGAVVGSATGDAGAGIVLGTVAGTATGALVGSQLENQDQAIATQKEEVRRQQEELDNNRRQIDELRRKTPTDTRVPGGTVATTTVQTTTPARARLAEPSRSYSYGRQPKPYVPEAGYVSEGARSYETSTTRTVTRSHTTVAASHGAVVTPRVKSAPVVETAKTQAIVERTLPDDTLPAVELPPANGLDEPVAVTPGVSEKVAALPAATTAQPIVKTPVKETAAKQAPASNDPACSGAEMEAKRARSSSSDADKLFYLRRAIRQCPSNVGYHLEIAKIYKSIGRNEDAAYEARQILDLEPSNHEAQQILSSSDSTKENL